MGMPPIMIDQNVGGVGAGGQANFRGPPKGMVDKRGGVVGGNVHAGMYKPPFKHVDVVYIDIPLGDDGGFMLRRQLLGNNVANVRRMVQEAGGTNENLRLRLRGIGSSYLEGPMKMELQEPLHFVVSSDQPQLLANAIEVVRHCIQTCRGSN